MGRKNWPVGQQVNPLASGLTYSPSPTHWPIGWPVGQHLIIRGRVITDQSIWGKASWQISMTISLSGHSEAHCQISTLTVANVATFCQQRLRKNFDPLHEPRNILEKSPLSQFSRPCGFTTSPQPNCMLRTAFGLIYSWFEGLAESYPFIIWKRRCTICVHDSEIYQCE